MPRGFLILLMALALFAAVGAYFLLGTDPEEAPPPPPEPRDRPRSESFVETDFSDAELVREVVTPEYVLEPPETPMPESYRKSLGRIRGRVVEADGTPVAGLMVDIYGISALELLQDTSAFMTDKPPEFSFRTGSVKTGEDGTFAHSEIYPRGFYGLGIDLGGPRATTRFLDDMPGPGEEKDLGDIVLGIYAVITGRVVDDLGTPQAGVRLRATNLPSVVFISGLQNYREGCSFLGRGGDRTLVIDPPPVFKQFVRLVPFPTTHSESDGTFRLEGVPLSLLTLVADREGLVTREKGPVSTARGGERDIGDVVMDRGVPVKGKVTDHEGRPAPDVEVRVGPLYGIPEVVVLQPPVKTDELGAFSVPGAPPFKAAFAVARRYPEDPWTVAGPFDPESEPPVIVLPPAYDLRLILTREDGLPVKEPVVKMKELNEFGPMMMPLMKPPTVRGQMSVRKDGVVDLKHLPPGEYEVLVTARGCGLTREAIELTAGGTEKQVILKPAHETRIRVVTKNKGMPVEWAEVTVAEADRDFFMGGTDLSRGRTDAEGLVVLDGLTAGKYKATASHPAFAVTGKELEVPYPEDTVIEVEPGGILEGQVFQGLSPDAPPYMLTLVLDGWTGTLEAQTPRMAVTDLEGKFKVKNLHPGGYKVVVLKRLLDEDPLGMGEVFRRGPLKDEEAEVLSEETTFLEILLEGDDRGPGAPLSGSVFVDGAPAVGARLGLYAKRRYEAQVDARGNYAFEKIPEGDHTLRINTLPGPTGRFDFRIRQRITVTPNVPCVASFTLYTGAIHGKVVHDAGNLPAVGIRVTARMEDDEAPYSARINTLTGLDGSFLIEGVPLGNYTVKADVKGFSSTPATGIKVLPRGRSGPVMIRVIEPILVSGTLILPEGFEDTKLFGMVLNPEKGTGGDQAWVRVNRETGDFETKNLTPGTYTIRCSGFGKGRIDFKGGPLVVPPGGVTGAVIRLEKVDDDSKKKDGE